jgi:predicted component of type VI protein secretion system
MDHIHEVVCGVLLLADAVRVEDIVVDEVARRWIRISNSLVSGVGGPQELLMDQQIVFGDQPVWLAGP